MAKPSRAPAFAGTDHVHVVIETPAGRRTKYAWDPELRAFKVSKVLPSGMVFPYDFGFVAQTRADDGDPLDAMVLADEPMVVGALVECRVLGVIEIATSEPGETQVTRNDRLVVVPTATLRGASWNDIGDLGTGLIDEVTEFFRSYITREGRRFELLGVRGRSEALAVVRTSAR